MRDGRWEWTIRMFKGETKLLEAVHRTTTSKDIELSVVRDRIKKGDFSHAEIIHHEEPFEQETIYK